MTDELKEVDLSKPLPPQEEKKEEKKEETEEKEKTMGELLSEFDGAPDDLQLEEWKQKHGEVLCSALSDKELYIFRPITRGEFVNLQNYISQSKEQVNNFDVEVKMVETCVLWASSDALKSLENKAGTYSTLHEQILQASNFMNPAYVSNFVVKL